MAILTQRGAANRDGGVDTALLILRLVLGLLMLLHGISKLPPPPPAFLAGAKEGSLELLTIWGTSLHAWVTTSPTFSWKT